MGKQNNNVAVEEINVVLEILRDIVGIDILFENGTSSS